MNRVSKLGLRQYDIGRYLQPHVGLRPLNYTQEKIYWRLVDLGIAEIRDNELGFFRGPQWDRYFPYDLETCWDVLYKGDE